MRRDTQFMKKVLACVLVLSSVSAFSSNSMAGDVKCKVELDRGVLVAGKSQQAIVRILLDAPSVSDRAQRAPINLSVVLDRSGSMSGQKIEKAKDAAVEALHRLTPRDIFSLVIYDHEVHTLVPAQRALNTGWIESQIRSVTARGNTALFGGVSQGASEIRKNLDPAYIHRVILLSDGLANVGPSTPDDLGRLGVALMKEKISVTTVGVGTDYNEDLMTRLSQNSDGNAYFVESSQDLPRIFAAELGQVLNVMAKNVTLIIECPEGVKPLGIIGREGRIKDRYVELSLNQLYGGQQKFILLEVEVAPAKANDTREVGLVKLSYTDALTNRQTSVTSQASVRFSGDEREVVNSANLDVQKDYNLTLNAMAQDKAIALSDQGRKQEAAEELKKSSAVLYELGTKTNDKKLIRKAEEVEQQATTIEKKGMGKTDRKALMTDSYQYRNQQNVK
jgi:Ca-activated chloride channel family protein